MASAVHMFGSLPMTENPYGRLDPWRDPSAFDDAKAREMAFTRLERRGKADDEISTRTAYLDLLALQPGELVLDVGCGSGVVTRDLALRIAPKGLAVGLDASPALLKVARELAEQSGLGAHVAWYAGDARSMPFADATFDTVVAATVLAHIPDGERAVPELVRVTRPGGRVGIFDLDGDSVVISHPDRPMTRRVIAALSDHTAMDAWFGRRLPGLLADAGLRDIRVRAFMPLERDPSGYYAGLAERAAEIAASTGAISDEEQQHWLDRLRAEQAANRFLAGRLHIFAWGTRPLVREGRSVGG